ncbi:YhgE/Pip domain-containing protein [Paraoerskovia marina]|uniref:YhgE/Pip domain-containing protein n=1 Tax=Paraoerskovia marina TaxID=545619 RepID=UPI00049285FD|nr:YhgE/Pip domain-containing protein [Paraoerskovia marina]
MSAFRLSVSELRRLTSGRMPRLAILAMALIPTLYAGLYLWANHDPYDRLDEIPAALVVQDEGATTTDASTGETTTANYGDDVADQLVEDGGFTWVETDEADAESGVRTGRYDAALVVGPEFSADLVSSGEFEPHQASLRLVTNDANNYLATTIAETIVGEVRDAIAAEVGTEAATEFLDGFDEIHTNLADAVDGAGDLQDGAADLDDGAHDLADGATDLSAGAGTAADGAATLADGAQQLSAGTGDLVAGADDLAAGTGTLATGAQSLSSGASDLSAGLEDLRGATADLPDQAQALADGAQQVADGNAEVAGYGDQAAAAATDVVDSLDAWRDDVEQTLVDQGVPQDEIDTILATLDEGRAPVEDAAEKVQGAAGQLDDLADGAAQVSDGATSLAAGADDLRAGVATAADGGADLADGAADLADGAATAADGAGDLDDGAQQLDSAAGALAVGASDLADGTADLDAGAQTLAAGTGSLAAGAGDLLTGTGDLHDGLADGLDDVPDLDDETRTETAETIGDPVAVDADSLSSAGTYGAGLAPFFLSLATWIGAYVLFLLVRPLSTRALASGRSALGAALGGWLTPFLLGVVQVVAMLAVTFFALHIDIAHGLGTVLFMILVSATYVAIVQTLNVYLGAAGQFLGLVLMLVQLVTAGGTFPWQTIPEPLRSLHQLLPMTYAVEGLRQLMYGGSASTVARDVAVLAGFLVVALAATTYAAVRQRMWTITRLEPELVL